MFPNYIILTIALPLLGAFLMPLLGRSNKKARNAWMLFILFLTDASALFLYWLTLKKGTMAYTMGARIPSLTLSQGIPIRIILVGDALSSFLALSFLFIASLVFIYSLKRLEEYSSLEKFYTLFLLLLAGILGFLFTGDFFTLFVFYEINSIATAGLIAFFRKGSSFRAAFHYLALFAIGSLFLLLGVGILYSQYGFLNMAIIAHILQSSFLDKIAFSFIASAVLLKVGAFPFYFWKPEAYNSAPASAVILSITSSLSAIYVLFRIAFDIFLPNASLGWLLVFFSLCSIFIGVILALKEKNLKRTLAYLAVSELGYIVLGISAGYLAFPLGFGFKAIEGGLFHMINDALDAGLLFLVAGLVLYAAGTDSASGLRGLAQRQPLLSATMFLGLLALSGMPPLNGFASKLIIFETIFHLSPLLTMLAMLGSILILAVMVKIFSSIFFGVPSGDYRPIPKTALAVIIIISLSMIVIGLFPREFVSHFIHPAAKALVGRDAYINSIIH